MVEDKTERPFPARVIWSIRRRPGLLRNAAVALRNRHALWWLLAAFLGLWPLCVRLFPQGFVQRNTEFLVVHGGLFSGGLLLGFFRPERFWRCCLATLLLLPCGDLVWGLGNFGSGPLLLEQSVAYVVSGSGAYLLALAVVLVGASLGSLISR